MTFVNFSKANCKNCYKCLRACPVKAIRINNEQAEVVEDRCIACGKCMVVCPQNARNIKSDFQRVKLAINAGKKVIATVAPSYVGAFNEGEYKKIPTALKKLGFTFAEETAIGAEYVSKLYEQYIGKEDYDNLITTCCPSTNLLIETYFPSLIKYMIPVVSPMIAHGRLLKEQYGCDSFVVFIGPCFSKQAEAYNDEVIGCIDAVLTFEEVEVWIQEEDIELANLEDGCFEKSSSKAAQGFPIGGGSLSGLGKGLNDMDIISVSGLEQCMDILKSLEKGELNNVCVELSACTGSCIGGPAMLNKENGLYLRQKQVLGYIDKCNEKDVITTDSTDYYDEKEKSLKNVNLHRKFKEKSIDRPKASPEEIKKILRDMGKFEKEDELNCGVCGYNTCLEKAQAIYEGMAESNMCLHYMRNKAESLSNVIFENSPNVIIMMDDELNIKEINPAAQEIFIISSESAKGRPVSMFLDDSDFKIVKETKEGIFCKRVNYPQYNAVFIENIVYLEKDEMILVIMNNIMPEEKNRKELLKVKENTLNAAQEVIEKQMRVAQEIASLLGETTAETKIILSKLKKIVAGEEDEKI